MRRLTVVLLLAALALAGTAGCKRKKRARIAEDQGTLTTVVAVAEPHATAQLIRGFHAVEQGAWRWTERRFAVTLRTPAGAAQKGAWLELGLAIPEASLAQLKSQTLSAVVNGYATPPETYRTAGVLSYKREIPPSALAGDAVTVEFTLDKALPPSAQDGRELGVIVTSVGLQPK